MTKEEFKLKKPKCEYHIKDLNECEKEEISMMYEELVELIKIGKVRGMPTQSYDIMNIKECMNMIKKANHLGKVILVKNKILNENKKWIMSGGYGSLSINNIQMDIKKRNKRQKCIVRK